MFMLDRKLFIELSHEIFKNNRGMLKYWDIPTRNNIIRHDYHEHAHARWKLVRAPRWDFSLAQKHDF